MDAVKEGEKLPVFGIVLYQIYHGSGPVSSNENFLTIASGGATEEALLLSV